MNEVRRAALEQLAEMQKAALAQIDKLLAAERQDVSDLPDNIEESEFASNVLKRPMFELSLARCHLLESIGHIASAVVKDSGL